MRYALSHSNQPLYSHSFKERALRIVEKTEQKDPTPPARADVLFNRRSVLAGQDGVLKNESQTAPAENIKVSIPPSVAAIASEEELNVLVINSSQEMAKEITLQLTLSIPGCSITYAPTLQLARWILSRRKIGLIVSSPVLPDGGIARLKDSLQKMQSPPDVVVVGDAKIKNAELLKESGYEFAAVRQLSGGIEPERTHNPLIIRRHITPAGGAAPAVEKKITSLGADIRNDLNNPLQEIVAMVFVAQVSGSLSQGTASALGAIEAAAKNMAQVVSRLEEKIRTVVS